MGSFLSQTKSAVAAVPRRAARGLVAVYRHTLSPLVGFHCRHMPTCSVYADQALDRFGLWAGGWMTLARLLRCHPFGTSGLDVVADALPLDARWYAPWRYARWRGTNPGPPLRGADLDADGSMPH
ncbi:MAG TPA: membrane protein insertion efficiency factor YidD [Xanthobacteraceae bacterium]|nr:membrane protein insertion efficiency factor YidD [Xanthobacteraceae bacterium]